MRATASIVMQSARCLALQGCDAARLMLGGAALTTLLSLQALRKHGSDFSFSAGQVQNNKVMIQRLVKAFALAQVCGTPISRHSRPVQSLPNLGLALHAGILHPLKSSGMLEVLCLMTCIPFTKDLRRVEEVQALSLRPAPGIMSCVSAKWPAALAILRQEASRARQTVRGSCRRSDLDIGNASSPETRAGCCIAALASQIMLAGSSSQLPYLPSVFIQKDLLMCSE